MKTGRHPLTNENGYNLWDIEPCNEETTTMVDILRSAISDAHEFKQDIKVIEDALNRYDTTLVRLDRELEDATTERVLMRIRLQNMKAMFDHNNNLRRSSTAFCAVS